jgi:hypothetical protein
MFDLEALTRRYAAASDEELREAEGIGPGGYRAEAWRVIHAELVRRGLRRADAERPKVSNVGWVAGGRAPRDEWTAGLFVGIVPAGLAAVAAFRALIAPVRMGRLIVYGPIIVFFGVWFGIALLVDLWRWRRGRQ